MLLLAALALLIGISYAKAKDVSYLCQFPQEWKADHSFEDPDSPGTFYTCEVYAGWVTGSGGGPTDVDASWTCAGTTQTEQYHVDTVSKFGCCGPSGKSACCSQIVTWRPGAEDECSPSPGPPPVYASPPPPTVVSYCLPRQDWQYHCEPYPNCDPSTCDPNTTGELECFMHSSHVAVAVILATTFKAIRLINATNVYRTTTRGSMEAQLVTVLARLVMLLIRASKALGQP